MSIVDKEIFFPFLAKNCTKDPVQADNTTKGYYDWDPLIGNKYYSLTVNYW